VAVHWQDSIMVFCDYWYLRTMVITTNYTEIGQNNNRLFMDGLKPSLLIRIMELYICTCRTEIYHLHWGGGG
jgi:hypothetical protein